MTSVALNTYANGRKNEPEAAASLSDLETLIVELSDVGSGADVFSSTLSPHEQYLLRQCGMIPLKVVTGNMVYSIGLKGVTNALKRALKQGEIHDLTQMNQLARDLAIKRLHQEAAAIGADGVVSVKVDLFQYADFVEITAIGTAVKKISEATNGDIDLTVGV